MSSAQELDRLDKAVEIFRPRKRKDRADLRIAQNETEVRVLAEFFRGKNVTLIRLSEGLRGQGLRANVSMVSEWLTLRRPIPEAQLAELKRIRSLIREWERRTGKDFATPK